MAKSIIQTERECFLCRREAGRQGYYGELPHTGLHKHHMLFGSGNRKKAEHYGLWCYLCVKHHEYGPDAVHKNQGVRVYLSKTAQHAFESRYPNRLFVQEFGKDWINGEGDSPGWEWESPEGAGGQQGKVEFIDTGLGDIPF